MLLCYDYYHVVPVEVGSYFACNFCVKIFLERSVPRTKNPIFGNSMSSLWLNDTKVVQLGVKLRAGKYFSEFTIARLSLCLSTWNIHNIEMIYVKHSIRHSIYKAFDKVCHRHFNPKLMRNSIYGKNIRWIRPFLTNRKQRVLLSVFSGCRSALWRAAGLSVGPVPVPSLHNHCLLNVDYLQTTPLHILPLTLS